MSGWKTKPLGELCEVLDRYRKPITKSDRREGPYPYYGAMGIVDYVDGFLFDEPLILLGEDGAKWGSGEPCAFKASGKYWVNNHAHIMRPDRSQVLDDWLVYYLCGFDLLPFITGLTVPKLNQERMREIPIPVPPLEEQRRIVAVLDEAFAAIATATANAEKNLANARELFENALGAAFADLASTTPERSIGEIAAIKGGKRVPKGYKLLSEVTPYPYLTVGDFTEDGTIDPSEVRYVSEDIRNQIKRYIIRTEDLYISIAGTIGRTGIVPPEFDEAQLTENACRLVFNAGISNKFVYFFTKSAAFRRQAIEQTRTAAQPKLALSRLEQIRLPVPDLDTQKRMIERFSELNDSTAQLADQSHEKLKLLAALKQSLFKRAFTGELTATMPETIAA